MPAPAIPLPDDPFLSTSARRRRGGLVAPSGAALLKASVFLLVPVAVLLALFGVIVSRSAPAPEVAAAAPPITAGSAPAPTVAVLTDGSSGALSDDWRDELGDRLGANVVTIDLDADRSVAAAVERVPSDADVVVVLLGRAGAAGSAAAVLGAAHVQAGYADLALIGPASGVSVDERRALAEVAANASVRWVDPVESGWSGGATVDHVRDAVLPLMPDTR